MSVRIGQCTWFAAPPDRVWAEIEDLSTHPTWMRDAVSVEFLTPEHATVGAEFSCLTKVGFLRNHDVLRVTEWEPGAVMGIEHTGVVTGTGRFTLVPEHAGNFRDKSFRMHQVLNGFKRDNQVELTV